MINDAMKKSLLPSNFTLPDANEDGKGMITMTNYGNKMLNFAFHVKETQSFNVSHGAKRKE